MNITDIWNIVWQDTPFHFAFAIILILAIVIEFCTFLEYFYLKCGETAKAINNLNNHRNPKYQSWKHEHLQTNERREFVKDNDKFILKKYPTTLARRTPRSHLRFVTTLCTSIVS